MTPRLVMLCAAALVVQGLASACAVRRSGSSAPVLDAISPDSAFMPAGSPGEVTLTGSGFGRAVPGDNVVHLGAAVLRGVPSSDDGRRLRFVIPDMITTAGEAPPSRLESGAYEVSVETRSGRSNALTIRIFR